MANRQKIILIGCDSISYGNNNVVIGSDIAYGNTLTVIGHEAKLTEIEQQSLGNYLLLKRAQGVALGFDVWCKCFLNQQQ